MNIEPHNAIGDLPVPAGFTIRAEISQSDKGGKPGGGKKHGRTAKKAASKKAPGGRASKKSK
jgi:hypothetical protein